MALNSVGIFLAGALMLSRPEIANELHGFGNFTVEVWFTRFSGLLFITISFLLSTTSRQVSDKPFQRIAVALIGINAILAMSLYSAPGTLTTGRQVSVALFGLVAFLFFVTLPIKPIGYKESEK